MGPAVKKFRIPPGAWFLVLVLLQALLAYAPLPLAARAVLALGLPLFLALAYQRLPLSKTKDPIPDMPSGVGIALGLVMVALRFFHPLTFVPWPLYDEAINAHYALALDTHWSWRTTFFYSHLPPFYIWLQALLFKATHSWLSAIRFEPILLSCASLPLAYLAARAFFSRPFAWLCLLLMGLGFWDLYFARISHQAVLLILWELAAIACLGWILRASPKDRKSRWVVLGLLAGTGFYTYFAWPLVAFWLMVIGGAFLLGQKKASWQEGTWFLIPFLLTLLPWMATAFQGGAGNYSASLFSLKAGNDWALQVYHSFFGFSAFFWGTPSKDFIYGPVWGGLFNPLTGAAALLGLLDLLWRREPLGRAVFLGLALFLSPLVLTSQMTLVREIAALPLLTFAAAWGLRTLVQGAKKPALVLASVLVVSTALDLAHLSQAEASLRASLPTLKTIENERAYRFLSLAEKKEGPGWLLTAFSNDLETNDRSLEVASYRFNGLQNPRFDPADSHWMGVVANVHFMPFLKERFPHAAFEQLSAPADAPRDDYNGGLMVMAMPITTKDRTTFEEWANLDRRVRELWDRTMDLSPTQARVERLAGLEALLPGLSKDPFLRSCYWEMVFSNHNWQNRFGDGDRRAHWAGSLVALQRGLKEGYPTAYFYNELGGCYAVAGDKVKARQAFLKAIAAPLDWTPAAENLKALEASR